MIGRLIIAALSSTNPSGDVEAVQSAWMASAEYADLLESIQEIGNRQLRTYSLASANFMAPNMITEKEVRDRHARDTVVIDDLMSSFGCPVQISFDVNKGSDLYKWLGKVLHEVAPKVAEEANGHPLVVKGFYPHAHDVKPRWRRKLRQEQFARKMGLTLREVKTGVMYKTARARIMMASGPWTRDADSWFEPTGERADYIIHDEPLPEDWAR